MIDLFINGAVGKLEAKYYPHPNPSAHFAIILHPHPLHGGTMNNTVVHNLFHTLKNHFSVLRFNFPGVGKSNGIFDHGMGELIAAANVLDWVLYNHPDASAYWIVGFSFGAWIAMQIAMRRPEINEFIAVAPPATSYDFGFLSPCLTPGLIIHGVKDPIVPEDSVRRLTEQLNKQNNVVVEYKPILDADHFFKGKLPELSAEVLKYISKKYKI
jgi:hypothetical protein